MIDQLLGKGGSFSRQPRHSPPYPAVASFDGLSVFLADQVLEIGQQGCELFPAVRAIKVDFNPFQPFEQIPDAGLVSFAHRDDQNLLRLTTIRIQDPHFPLFAAHKRPHFVNLDFEIPFVARFDLDTLAPADDQAQDGARTDQQDGADVTNATPAQQHPLDQHAGLRVAGVVQVLVLELLATAFAPIVLLTIGLLAIPDYLYTSAVKAFELQLCFAHKAQNYAFAAFLFTSYI